MSVDAVSLFRDGECSGVKSALTRCCTHPGRSHPQGLTLQLPHRPLAFSPAQGTRFPRLSSRLTPVAPRLPGRLRDFATLRVEKQSPRSGPSSGPTRSRPHTHVRSASQCVGLRRTAFSVVQPPVAVQPPEPPGPLTVRPFLCWPTTCHGNVAASVEVQPLEWCSHSSRQLPSGRDFVLLALTSQLYFCWCSQLVRFSRIWCAD